MTNAKERDSSTLFLAWDVLEWLVRLRTAIIVSDYFVAVGSKYMSKYIYYRCDAWLRESTVPLFSKSMLLSSTSDICHASHLSSSSKQAFKQKSNLVCTSSVQIKIQSAPAAPEQFEIFRY